MSSIFLEEGVEMYSCEHTQFEMFLENRKHQNLSSIRARIFVDIAAVVFMVVVAPFSPMAIFPEPEIVVGSDQVLTKCLLNE